MKQVIEKAFDADMWRKSGVWSAEEDMEFITSVMSILEKDRDLVDEKQKTLKVIAERRQGMTTCPKGILLVWDSQEEP